MALDNPDAVAFPFFDDMPEGQYINDQFNYAIQVYTSQLPTAAAQAAEIAGSSLGEDWVLD